MCEGFDYYTTRENETDIDRHICICVENLDNNSLSRNYWIIKHYFFAQETTREKRDDIMRNIMLRIAAIGTWERQVYFPPQGIKAIILDVQDQG